MPNLTPTIVADAMMPIGDRTGVVSQAVSVPIGGRQIAELDGLRGLAILMVVAFHFWPETFALRELSHGLGAVSTKVVQLGKYGVELFFVLSGFLISGILLDSRGRPGYFRRFYMRRFLRIFPLYYGTLAVLLLLLPLLVPLDEGASVVRQHAGWLWAYLINLPSSITGLTLEWDASKFFWIGHFWSLCVEEHFYLLWPLVVWLAGARRLTAACMTVLVAGAAIRVIHAALTAWSGVPTLDILGWSSLTKLDGLALGSMVAVYARRESPTGGLLTLARRSFWPLAAGIGLLGVIPRRHESLWLGVPGETLFALFFAAILVRTVFESADSWWRRPFRLSCIRFLGTYSYGLYVFHGVLWPVLTRSIQPERIHSIIPFAPVSLLVYLLIQGGVCTAIAYASYHVWEEPFLRLKRFFPSGASVPTAARA